jgi:hypothetical protein
MSPQRSGLRSSNPGTADCLDVALWIFAEPPALHAPAAKLQAGHPDQYLSTSGWRARGLRRSLLISASVLDDHIGAVHVMNAHRRAMKPMGIGNTGSDRTVENRGFTRQELHDIFNLDPDRPEDRATIAALQASSSRQCDQVRPAGHPRGLRNAVMKTLRNPARQVDWRGNGPT